MPFTQFPISRQGLQDIAMFLVAGAVLFAVLAFVRRQRGGDVRRQVQAVGALAVLTAVAYALAFTVAPNIPTPAVPFTARFARNPWPTHREHRGGPFHLQENCAVCHGRAAWADGPAAFTLNPRR